MHHPLALRAFQTLYPGSAVTRRLSIRYSGRFRGFNANVTMTPAEVRFALARKFLEVGDEIQIGVIQYLLNRLHRTRHDTLEIQLYNSFVKRLADFSTPTKIDQRLLGRFSSLNEEYFAGMMAVPNLVIGPHALSRLGHYDYATDTITISGALLEDGEMLDYVLYHEMLHKKHKFSESKGGFTRSHTKAFREDERKFRLPDAERRLESFVARKRRAGRLLAG